MPALSASALVVMARVLAAVDGGVPSDEPAYARRDQRVTLVAAVAIPGAGWYSDAPQIRIAGRTVRPRALAALGATIRWYRVEPRVATMSNTASGSFRFEPVSYERTALDAHGSVVAADVRPTLTPDHGHGVGTMRFAIDAILASGASASSPGPEARRGKGSGGLDDDVLRVSIRRDDSYLGYLTEMYGQPYIWASAGTSTRSHQSERLEGSDCADFVVYGARRMGRSLDYTWSGGLPEVTRLVARGHRAPADGGRGPRPYRDASGQPVPFPAVGSIALFPRHVGILAADRGLPGVLDDHDLLMHTLFDSPREQALADSGYADAVLEVRRWR